MMVSELTKLKSLMLKITSLGHCLLKCKKLGVVSQLVSGNPKYTSVAATVEVQMVMAHLKSLSA